MPMATAQVSAGPKAISWSAGPSGGGVPRTFRHMAVISRCVTTTETAAASGADALPNQPLFRPVDRLSS